MSRLFMMAGSMATGGDPPAEQVSAYVVFSEGAKSRLFKLSGPRSKPNIEELSSTTTLDLKRFQRQVNEDLAGMTDHRAVEQAWACDMIRVHLRADLGI